jgi:hypothetical protein
VVARFSNWQLRQCVMWWRLLLPYEQVSAVISQLVLFFVVVVVHGEQTRSEISGK